MAEYFETDQVVRKFDGALVRRILSYLKPYRLSVVLAMVALAVSSAGELLVPVLLQRTVDKAILADYRRLDADAGEIPESLLPRRAGAVGTGTAFSIGPYLLVPASELSKLSRAETADLERRGVLDGASWYATRLEPGDAAQAAALSACPSAVSDAAGNAALKKEELKTLPPAARRALRSADLSYLSAISGLFLLILAVVLLATFAQTWITSRIGQDVMKDLRTALFERTADQSLSFLSRHPVGRLVTRLTGDVETINEFFTSVLSAFLKDFSIMAGALVVLYFLSWRLALIATLTLPPVAVAAAISRVKARDAFRRQRLSVSKLNAYLAERISGVQIVQLFGRESATAGEFGDRNQELLHANLGEMYVYATFRPVVDFLSSFSMAVVIFGGAWLFLGASATIGVIIAFVNLVQMFYSPVQDLSDKYTLLQSAMAGGERVFQLLDTDERIVDAPSVPMPKPLRGGIRFENVRFSYVPGEPVLKDLSFSVSPGETVAIVGYTGAGKTTITNLIARLWDVDAGVISIDGVPIKDLPLRELRRTVLPVLQDVFLFSGTLADNIRLGSDISDQELIAAAEAAHADDFISRLPDGYDTVLSEGATNISAGQRQLISFARVIANDPRIVILDEATSSIDTETERLIQLGMERLLAGRTSIVIAHRLSTIRHADRILVLSGGALVEQGSHDELLAADGLYAKLYRLQYERSVS